MRRLRFSWQNGAAVEQIATVHSVRDRFQAVAMTAADSSNRHVRAADPRILSLVQAGLTQSGMFRQLVMRVDDSDVIAYLEARRMPGSLDAYLIQHLHANGGFRYLRIAVGTHGSPRRLVAGLAHELQHAVEVSETPDARDPASLEQAFAAIAIAGCGISPCYETQAAKDVEDAVNEELGRPRK
jgi:hypothetical protein